MEELSKGNDISKTRIKITDLSRLSGVSKSSIYNYLNMGLLPPPKKLGLSHLVYDWTHLNNLKRIRELRQIQRLPLAKIKEILSGEDLNITPIHREVEAESLIRALEDLGASEREIKECIAHGAR